MSAPVQVRRAAQAAEKLQRELFSASETPDQGETAPETPPEPTPEPAAELQQPTSAETSFEGSEGSQPVSEAPQPPPAPPHDDWEERYKALNGKYQAEVPRLHRQLKQMAADLESMRALLGSMQQVKAPDKPAEPSPAVTDKDIEDYGEDLIGLMTRASKASVSPELETLKNRIAQLEGMLGNVNQHVVKSEREKMFETLATRVPNYLQLNEDPNFLSWLAQPDPYSGHTRQEMLDHASTNNDAARVVAFFEGFLRESSAVTPPSGAPVQRAPTRKLEDMAAPGAGRSGTASAPTGKDRIWSQRDIAKFYRDVMDGKYKHDPKQKDAIERQIIKATNEGRVTA